MRHVSVAAALVLVVGSPTFASFHLMQIEQVIGGVNGDTTAQAIQLRMRALGQNLVSNARINVRDATGANPILILNMTTNVASGTAGRRVLIASPNFADYTVPGTTPDFTMTNFIPASYLAAGSLTFEDDFGTIYWRLSWGGAAYTGSNTGSITNDADGNFGPPFGGPLPSGGHQALRFPGAFSALSTTNLADYALTPGAATFTNNATAPFLVSDPQCLSCGGDLNSDLAVNSLDIQEFVNCSSGGSLILRTCGCADEDFNGVIDQADIDTFVNDVINETVPSC